MEDTKPDTKSDKKPSTKPDTKGKKNRLGKKIALGRGLSALIPNAMPTEQEKDSYFQCNLNDIVPNKYQPRRVFDEDELNKLSASIKDKGVLQPILVRKREVGYEIIVGERRFKAACMANIEYIPLDQISAYIIPYMALI